MADGNYWKDIEAAHKYRDETLVFVESCLGLGTSTTPAATSNRVIDSFSVIGEDLQRSCSIRAPRPADPAPVFGIDY